jgi:predicted dehydrogenase
MARIGIIGAGNISGTHLKSLSKIKDAEIVALADVIEDKTKDVATRFGIKKTYLDYKEMIEKENLDAVYILTPPYLHEEQICFAASENVNIFVEKPIECDIKRAKKVLETIRKQKVITQVGYQWRFMDGLLKAREFLITQGGSIGLIEGRWWGGIPVPPGHWWLDKSKSGGQITEQATHIFDQARWLGGEVREIYCVSDTLLNNDVPTFNIEDVTISTLKFKSEALGVITSTNAANFGEVWIKVVAKNLGYEADSSKATLHWKERTEIFYNRLNAYDQADECFIECVKRGEDTPITIEEGYKSLELSLAALKSKQEGKTVSLPI